MQVLATGGVAGAGGGISSQVTGFDPGNCPYGFPQYTPACPLGAVYGSETHTRTLVGDCCKCQLDVSVELEYENDGQLGSPITTALVGGGWGVITLHGTLYSNMIAIVWDSSGVIDQAMIEVDLAIDTENLIDSDNGEKSLAVTVNDCFVQLSLGSSVDPDYHVHPSGYQAGGPGSFAVIDGFIYGVTTFEIEPDTECDDDGDDLGKTP